MIAVGRYRVGDVGRADFACASRGTSGVWRWREGGVERAWRWSEHENTENPVPPLAAMLGAEILGPKPPGGLHAQFDGEDLILDARSKLVASWPSRYRMDALLRDTAALEVSPPKTDAERKAALDLRLRVFVEEQLVPRDLELDAADATALHIVARLRGWDIIGTGRLTPDNNGAARVGRMAVDRDYRGLGVGALMLLKLEQAAEQRGCPSLVLHAQIRAESFYARVGFTRHGEVFEEAGIAHIEMHKPLAR